MCVGMNIGLRVVLEGITSSSVSCSEWKVRGFIKSVNASVGVRNMLMVLVL